MVALFAAVTIGATACSGNPGAVVARSVSPSASASVSASASPSTTTASPPPSPAPTPPHAATLARSTPVRLQIAAIGVDSTLMMLGLRGDGTLEVPKGGFPAGWYDRGPTPGEMGPAVIVGHIDMNGPGVFYKLHIMKPGDTVTITRADGSKPVFRVKQVEQYLKATFPTKLVYGNLDHAGLRLITCGGTFNSQTGHYEDNLVVFADLITAAG
jgi:hypothetical protein